jgi:hypothetical protein
VRAAFDRRGTRTPSHCHEPRLKLPLPVVRPQRVAKGKLVTNRRYRDHRSQARNKMLNCFPSLRRGSSGGLEGAGSKAISGEATYAEFEQLKREMIEASLSRHDGRLIKTTGDGALAEFASPRESRKTRMPRVIVPILMTLQPSRRGPPWRGWCRVDQ